MIQALVFGEAAPFATRTVRRAHFEARSLMPVSAACVVANGVRERLAHAYNCEVDLRLFAPEIPSPQAWKLLFEGARVYAVDGSSGGAAIVLRPEAALALASAAFGEAPAMRSREVSPIEEAVLLRAVRTIAPALGAVCGTFDARDLRRVASAAPYVTYFELLAGAPLHARVGIALARDPQTAPGPGLTIADLAEVEIDASVEFARAEIGARELLLLQPNTRLRMATKVGAPAALKVAGRIVARGRCGALHGRAAFVAGNAPKGGTL